ncbi:uncharacterized protein LOC143074669 isoform X2 [Mytilus galloprovincialis]|uniref:uncharacterized protein LOC143074669 isoform X2 n=1 Tax=Mytilus galloprovincialis TaxID=29158 RepID=UPI003F7C9FC5
MQVFNSKSEKKIRCIQLKMFKHPIMLASILFLYLVRSEIKLTCPSGKHWNLRARSFCLSVEQYTCLLDYVNNVYKESCNGPKIEPPGDKTVVNSGNFDTESCQMKGFQPFSFVTTQGNNCIYKKTMCNEEGQLIFNNGTNVNDRKCRCDYTKNFSFVSTKRVDMCSCDPSNEDCSCSIKLCSEGQILTPDYQCVKIEDSYGKFVCKDIEIQSSQSNGEKHNETKRTHSNQSDKQNRKNIALIVCSAGIIVAGTCFLYVVLISPTHETVDIFGTETAVKHNVKNNFESIVFDKDQNTKTEENNSRYRIHEAKLESYKNQPFEYKILKDLIKDGTIETYDFPENKTKLDTAQSEEDKALQTIFEKYKNEYIICRRKVEQNHATVKHNNELASVTF